MIEWLVSTALSTLVTEKLRPLFIRRKQSNVKKIEQYYLKQMPYVHTVGELRAILDDFADDVPLGYKSDCFVVQTRQLDDYGYIHLGQCTTHEVYSHRRRTSNWPPRSEVPCE